MEKLTSPQQILLDSACTEYCASLCNVPGRILRNRSTPGQYEDLQALVPFYLTRYGQVLVDDVYVPTLNGLLASSGCAHYSAALEGVLRFFHSLLWQQPKQHYSSSQLMGSHATKDDISATFATMQVARLMGGSQNPSPDKDGLVSFTFGLPIAFEHIARTHQDCASFQACPQCNPSPSPDPEPGTLETLTAGGALIQKVIDSTPETLDLDEVPPLEFMTDSRLRHIVERDCREALRCFKCEAWKAVIILCGSAIEGVLLDTCLPREGEVRKVVKGLHTDTAQWKLAQMLEAADTLGWITKGAQAIHDGVRNHRNLVHPGKERSEPYKVDRLEAVMALGGLRMVIRDVSANPK